MSLDHISAGIYNRNINKCLARHMVWLHKTTSQTTYYYYHIYQFGTGRHQYTKVKAYTRCLPVAKGTYKQRESKTTNMVGQN